MEVDLQFTYFWAEDLLATYFKFRSNHMQYKNIKRAALFCELLKSRKMGRFCYALPPYTTEDNGRGHGLFELWIEGRIGTIMGPVPRRAVFASPFSRLDACCDDSPCYYCEVSSTQSALYSHQIRKRFPLHGDALSLAAEKPIPCRMESQHILRSALCTQKCLEVAADKLFDCARPDRKTLRRV